MNFSLVSCDQNGDPITAVSEMSEELTANCRATADLFGRIGFEPPWIGYIAVADGRAVGGGAFVGAPKDGFVEIAYYTLESEQGQGFASRTTASLVAIARDHSPEIGLKAFTLQEENASTKILRRLGFSIVGTAEDADAGEVWEWRA
ncbi:MAG: GNAT family N-acetyltransferase [Pyrinomonadaceae bacterium]|nr:GNAT family N-acetyltransferase [Pyrinomonadaceae bacterium]